MQNLVDEIGIEIRIAHYPPYTSKWNPIEHRLFPHITRAMQGILLKNHLMVKELLEKTKIKTGLRVIANITDKIYSTGKGYAKGFKKNMKIKFDNFFGKWNYRAIPMQIQEREYFVNWCVQRRLVCTAGARPAGVKVRSPVAKVAAWRETGMLKPTDKVILRMASE